MQQLIDLGAQIAHGTETLAGWMWGWPLIVILTSTHLFFTIRLGFIQKWTFSAIRLSLHRKAEGEGDISHFGALMTALAATVGTGNITGVSAAVALGGPGAVLWMWLTGVFGIATKYAEALVSIKYRVKAHDGTMAGGPMYVLERACGLKWMGVAFAVFTVIASFGIGNMVQSNSIAELLNQNFGLERWITGLLLAGMTALVILGGVRSIAKVCEVLVPVMAIVYIVSCVVLLIMHWSDLPATFRLIFESAFSGQAAVGGFLGAGVREAVRFGIARGLFSNESGMGSAPIIAAAAQTKSAVRQALVSSTGTFWDTVVICALTGLVVVAGGHWQEGLKGAQLTSATFADMHLFGPHLLTFSLFTFVASTILGWCYYGEKALQYLHDAKGWITAYRGLWVVAVFAGCVFPLSFVWNFADVANGMMAIPNIIALFLLHNVIAAETRRGLAEALSTKAE